MQEVSETQAEEVNQLPWRQWFGRELKKRRLVLGASQFDISRKLQTGGRTSLTNYEKGISEPTAMNFLRLLKALDLDVNSIPMTNMVDGAYTLTSETPLERTARGPQVPRSKEKREFEP